MNSSNFLNKYSDIPRTKFFSTVTVFLNYMWCLRFLCFMITSYLIFKTINAKILALEKKTVLGNPTHVSTKLSRFLMYIFFMFLLVTELQIFLNKHLGYKDLVRPAHIGFHFITQNKPNLLKFTVTS